MGFTVDYDVPGDVADTLRENWLLLARMNLEDIAVIGYKTGVLTSCQVEKMLGFESRWRTEEFLSRHQCHLHYNESDLNADQKAMINFVEDASR